MTERDRRALTIGGGVVLGAVLFLRLAPWGVRSVLGAEAGLRERATLLARARADVATAPVLRDSVLRVAQALVGLAPKILSGRSATEAVADLSGRLNLVVSGHHAKLERVDPRPDSLVAGRLHRVTLRAAFECDVRGLAGVLEALAFGKVVLPLRELRVTAVDAGSSAPVPEVLQVEMTVTGWYLASPDSDHVKVEGGNQ